MKHFFHIVLNGGSVVANVGTHEQVLNDGHAGEHTATFWHHGQALLDQIPRALAHNAFAQILNVTRMDRQGTRDGFHGTCFARTVRPNERHQLTLMHFKINAFDSLNAAVGYLQAFDF